MKIQFHVRQEDIANGVSYCKSCPVAKALNRYLKPDYYAAVDLQNVRIHRRDLKNSIVSEAKCNTEVSRFIKAFDGDWRVSPTRLELEFSSNEPFVGSRN